MRPEAKMAPQDLYHIISQLLPERYIRFPEYAFFPGQPPVNLKHSVLSFCQDFALPSMLL